MATSTIKAIIWQDFEGGLSVDQKQGQKNSFAYMQSVDFRTSPSQATPLPQPIREDKNVITDLLQEDVMVSNGVIYSMGNNGNFYQRSASNVWGQIGKVRNGYFGMDYRQDLDSVYLCSDKTVSLYNPISTGPNLSVDYYNISQSTYNNSSNAGFNVNTNQTGSSMTTQILTTFAEIQTQERFFQSDIEPLNKISIFIVSKGTGNWTLTLHDGLNNIKGTATVLNANLTNGQFNDFVFSSAPNGQVRISVAPGAQTYHIHVTSTVADGTVSSSALNDLSTCDLEIWADRLVIPINGMHPMANFQQFECIGNERYLSVWEPLGDPAPDNSEWQRHRLIFPPYYQVCGLAVLNEYIAIACERIPTGNNQAQDGIIFWWDGLQQTYNYFTQIPEGSPYGIQSINNYVEYVAGGALYAITSAGAQPQKLRTLPNAQNNFLGTTNKTVVYPNASTVRNDVLLFAYPSTSTNLSIPYGVYSYGQIEKSYPLSFGYDYLLSTGDNINTGSNNLTVGMVKNHGDTLHISWRDGNNYGVDVVNSSSPPAYYSTIESMIFDNSYVGKLKTSYYMEVAYSTMPANCYFQMKFSIDRGPWVVDPVTYSSTTLWQGRHGYARFSTNTSSSTTINNDGRFREMQCGIDIYCPSGKGITQPPTFTMISLVFDTNGNEVLQ
jgi:hypothetical protein